MSRECFDTIEKKIEFGGDLYGVILTIEKYVVA